MHTSPHLQTSTTSSSLPFLPSGDTPTNAKNPRHIKHNPVTLTTSNDTFQLCLYKKKDKKESI